MSKRYFCEYTTPENFDDMIMMSDGVSLCSLVFKNLPDVTKKFKCAAGREKENLSEEGHAVLLKNVSGSEKEKREDLEIFEQTRKWLDIYFGGKNPDFLPSLSPGIRTEFCARVSEIMQDDNLRRNRKKDSRRKRYKKNVRAGGGRRGRIKPRVHNNPVSPRSRRKRQAYGLRRRNKKQNRAFKARRHKQYSPISRLSLNIGVKLCFFVILGKKP